MTRHTNIELRPEGEDDGDGLTDQAVLHYRRLAAEEKKKSRGVRGALPGEIGHTGAAGLGMAAVSFDDTQLHAEVSGAPDPAEDPWGAEDDDYAVPAAVTRADDDERSRRRRRGGGMALRGSGTRGGAKAGGPAGGPAPMMGGAPGAGAGGVGGVGGVAPTPPTAATAGMSAGPQLGMVQNSAGGSMPVGLLQNAQNSSRAATSAAYAPPAGTGGLQAASAGPGVYDPELLREALKANGFARGSETGAGSDLVDTDGDGIGDTPREEAERGGRGNGPTGGSNLTVLPIGGNGSATGPGLTPGSTAPGSGTPSSSTPGSSTTGSSTAGTRQPGSTPVVTPGTPTGGAGVGSQGGSGTGGGGAGAGTGGSGTGSGTGVGSYSGPSAAGGGTGGSGVDFSQSTPSYSGSGGGGYAVTTDDLRRDSRQWADVADGTTPVTQTIISAPDAARMFGHMKSPMLAYREAVATSQDRNVQAGSQSMSISEALEETAGNFDRQEESAVIESGRMNG